ncbi:sensor histidine kinase [Amycolatopsis sp. NPDC004747]
MRVQPIPDWLRTDVSRAAQAGAVVGDATYQLGRLLGYLAAALRGGVAVVGGAAAVISMAPPATPAWVLPSAAINVGWASTLAWITATRGLVTWVMTTDIVLTSGLCLGLGRLVPPAVLPAGASWVSVLASMTIVSAHLAWRARTAVLAGLLVTAAYLVGAGWAEAVDGGVIAAIVFLIQNASMAVMMVLLRQATRFADTALGAYHEAERVSSVERARRASAREQNRRLHDTVLATLTMVGAGAIQRSTPALRERAVADLTVIERLAEETVRAAGSVRLDHVLDGVVARYEPLVVVSPRLDACVVPEPVADAVAGAVGEALLNVVHHAGTRDVLLETSASSTGFSVTVVDSGRGFDSAAVPAHHYGIRESVEGRMRAVGGEGCVVSVPGAGTRVELRWPCDDR